MLPFSIFVYLLARIVIIGVDINCAFTDVCRDALRQTNTVRFLDITVICPLHYFDFVGCLCNLVACCLKPGIQFLESAACYLLKVCDRTLKPVDPNRDPVNLLRISIRLIVRPADIVAAAGTGEFILISACITFGFVELVFMLGNRCLLPCFFFALFRRFQKQDCRSHRYRIRYRPYSDTA